MGRGGWDFHVFLMITVVIANVQRCELLWRSSRMMSMVLRQLRMYMATGRWAYPSMLAC